MYSAFQLAKKYLQYYVHASNGKGHGVHSPFVFDFVKNVLNDNKEYACYQQIESVRRKLLRDPSIIEVQDLGAGSAFIKTTKRAVNKIAASSLKRKKYSQLLFRIVQYYKPAFIVELGTSFGITTSYMASGNEHATVISLEGAPAIADIAKQSFKELELKNIVVAGGDFQQTLPPVLADIKTVDLAFVDGNHRKKPTLEYFTMLLEGSAISTTIIFDDIHWSEEMEEAWEVIQGHPAVTLTIDLFFIGIVFVNPAFKVKQHFQIRF
ncbi:MAG: class I SAM-dependent methyltransferase [Ferruginibacter sp.]